MANGREYVGFVRVQHTLKARRGRASAAWIAVFVLLGIVGCGGSRGSVSGALPDTLDRPYRAKASLQHIIVVIQENRSFDNLFATFPGADGATTGKMLVKQNGKYVPTIVALKPHSLLLSTDIDHTHASFRTAYHKGDMDGFNLVDLGAGGKGGRPAGTLVYQYVKRGEIRPYWELARQYVLADHLFQTQGSGSFTAHQDLIRGSTTLPSGDSLVDNPDGMPWGCDAPARVWTDLITPGGRFLRAAGPFPCLGYATLRDLLDAKSISWKYYSPAFVGCKSCKPYNSCTTCAGALLNAFDVIRSVRYGSEWTTNIAMPETRIFSDIKKKTLPNVAWVIPDEVNSDHPGAPKDHGPAWVAQIVNALGQSSYWKSTAIVIVWDDWGGLYDHVRPPQQNSQGGLGFRVPMIVVSPYAPKGNVVHTVYQFGSILRCIEDTFGLGRLGTTDDVATSMCGTLDLSQTPRAFHTIAADQSLQYFETEPPSNLPGDPE